MKAHESLLTIPGGHDDPLLSVIAHFDGPEMSFHSLELHPCLPGHIVMTCSQKNFRGADAIVDQDLDTAIDSPFFVRKHTGLSPSSTAPSFSVQIKDATGPHNIIFSAQSPSQIHNSGPPRSGRL